MYNSRPCTLYQAHTSGYSCMIDAGSGSAASWRSCENSPKSAFVGLCPKRNECPARRLSPTISHTRRRVTSNMVSPVEPDTMLRRPRWRFAKASAILADTSEFARPAGDCMNCHFAPNTASRSVWNRPSNITLVIHSSQKSSISAAMNADPGASGSAFLSAKVASSSSISGVESFA